MKIQGQTDGTFAIINGDQQIIADGFTTKESAKKALQPYLVQFRETDPVSRNVATIETPSEWKDPNYEYLEVPIDPSRRRPYWTLDVRVVGTIDLVLPFDKNGNPPVLNPHDVILEKNHNSLLVRREETELFTTPSKIYTINNYRDDIMMENPGWEYLGTTFSNFVFRKSL